MTRLDLPDGQWAVMAAARKVSERKRRRYIAAVSDLASATNLLPRVPERPDEPDPRHFTAEHTRLADVVSDQLILCLVREWSYGEVSVEVLEDVPVDAFDVIFRYCRGKAGELVPDYSPDPDPKAPTSVSTLLPPDSSTEAAASEIPSFAATS